MRTVAAIRVAVAFLVVTFPSGLGAAERSIDEAIITKAEATLAIVECPSPDTLHMRRTTAVVIASDDAHSFLATAENRRCDRMVYPAGNPGHGYRARTIGLSVAGRTELAPLWPDDLEIIEIDCGNLPPAVLAPGVTTGSVFLLGFVARNSGTSNSEATTARLNDGTLTGGSGFSNLVAIRGVSPGAGVFEPTTGELVGVVTFVVDTLSLEPNREVDPRISYDAAFANAIVELGKHSDPAIMPTLDAAAPTASDPSRSSTRSRCDAARARRARSDARRP